MSASDKKKLRKEQAAGMTDRQKQARKEATTVKIYTWIFVTVVILAVVVAVGVLINRWFQSSGILERNTVAVTFDDGKKLSAADLNYYFIDAVVGDYNDAYSNSGGYADAYMAYLGLDTTKPLDQQDYITGNETWADHYANLAVNNAKQTYAICKEAKAQGFTLTEENIATIDSQMNNLGSYATYLGFSNAQAYLKSSYGPGANLESFRAYLEDMALASAYQAHYNESLTFDAERIAAYDEENSQAFNSYTYAYYTVPVSSFLPDTGEDSENGGEAEITDEQRAEAEAAAEEAARKLLDSNKDSLFDKAIAAMDINKDNENAASTKANRYFSTQISASAVYHDWVLDDSRQPGDMEVFPVTSTSTQDGEEVTTTTGYTVVLFQERSDNRIRMADVRHILIPFAHEDSSDTSDTFSDEEKQAAKEKAEEVYQQWKDGEATEDSFAALAATESSDSSASNGGLITDIYEGMTVEPFNDWLFDESRQPGDNGIVESEYGYHVMYYVAAGENDYRDYMIIETLRSTDMNEWLSGIVENVTVTDGDTSRLSRSMVLSSGQ